jgi:integrase
MDEIEVKVHSYGPGRCLALVWIDPVTGKKNAKSSGTKDAKEAERAAAVLEAELNSGQYQRPSRLPWADFRRKYLEEKMPGLAPRSSDAVCSAFNHLERVLNPDRLVKLTTPTLTRFQAKLRKEGMKDTTIATHLRQIKAALSWAVLQGLLKSMPKIELPKRAKGQRLMRGRPVVAEEFDRMIAQAPKIRPHDSAAWVHYLEGLWFSGLRLGESVRLSWDEDAPFFVDLSGRRPVFRIYGEAQKSGRDELLPMTPDFAEWLAQTPEAERTGRVFNLSGLQTSEPLAAQWAGRIVSKIGRAAGIIVNKAEGKFASAHDLRRSFGTRWAPKVKPATLQLLMRHSSIETTLRYYVAQDAADVGDELWTAWGGNTPNPGNTFGNTRPNTTSYSGNG